MTDFDELYEELKTYIATIEMKFIYQYLTKSALPSDDYELSVRAYCLLAHAAFEDYFETVAVELLEFSHGAWNKYQVYSDVLLALVNKFPIKPADADKESRRKSSELLNEIISNARTKFRELVAKNHGVDVHYLRELLEPVCLDFTSDATLLNSLNLLVQGRGDFAHRGRSVKRLVSPEDAKGQVSDCLKICEELKDNAKQKIEFISMLMRLKTNLPL